MSTMRARDSRRFVEDEPPPAELLLSVRAGEVVVIQVGAVDRQSGVSEVIARCRSRENPELTSTGRWAPSLGRRQPADNYYPVAVAIPRQSPTVVWEVHSITLCDGEGNRRSYAAGKDYEEMLFQVLGRDAVDSTPPRLLGVRLGRA
jgi:hypothetical protein